LVLLLVQNLRVALVLDPDNPKFKSRIQSNPAILSRTNMHWMEALTQPQQSSLAQSALKGCFAQNTEEANQVDSLETWLCAIHAAAAHHVSVTPQHFKSLVSQTASVVVERKLAHAEQIDFLQACI
jgi:hypothetical protein